jgi:Domain of unknown function (DUF4760)
VQHVGGCLACGVVCQNQCRLILKRDSSPPVERHENAQPVLAHSVQSVFSLERTLFRGIAGAPVCHWSLFVDPKLIDAVNAVAEPNWTSVVQAIASVVVAVLSTLIIVQIWVTRDLNRKNATFGYFNNETAVAHERAVADVFRQIGLRFHDHEDPLTTEAMTKLLDSTQDHYQTVKSHLNFLEDYAVAIHTRVLDEEAAYRMMCHVVCRQHRVFEPLIDFRRNRTSPPKPLLWIELENLAKKWRVKLSAELIQPGATAQSSPTAATVSQ